jgi:hypothetical protein
LLLPIAGVAGLLVGLSAGVDPIHDLSLLVFEGVWVALGVALLRAEARRGPEATPVPV